MRSITGIPCFAFIWYQAISVLPENGPEWNTAGWHLQQLLTPKNKQPPQKQYPNPLLFWEKQVLRMQKLYFFWSTFDKSCPTFVRNHSTFVNFSAS
jgi:hypothetical protein